MSHSDSIKALPTNGEVSTHDVEFVLTKLREKPLCYSIPSWSISPTDGSQMLENF
jgi:hypothetical protein